MRLSIVLPTNRVGPGPYARILEACAWGSDDVEVIVRDNSTNPKKRAFLEKIEAKNCRIVFAEPCQFFTNFRDVIELASGEFILTFSDDDFIDVQALDLIRETIDKVRNDPSVVGILGDYLLTSTQSSSLLRFKGMDAGTPAERYMGYLTSGSVSVVLWAIHRREMLRDAARLVKTLPMEFSFHDIVLTAIFLTCGRYVSLDRYLYHYAGISNWNNVKSIYDGDYKYYAKVGLDTSAFRLHGLFCAFEGAKLILANQIAKNVSLEERIDFARLWYSDMRRRLPRSLWIAETHTAADRLAMKVEDKWTREKDSLIFDEMLKDLTDVMALSNPQMAQTYYDYWSGI
jgi:hypothetical protein